jgi:hypothetical protein
MLEVVAWTVNQANLKDKLVLAVISFSIWTGPSLVVVLLETYN